MSLCVQECKNRGGVEDNTSTSPDFLLLDDFHAECLRQCGGLGGGDGDVFELGWRDGD